MSCHLATNQILSKSSPIKLLAFNKSFKSVICFCSRSFKSHQASSKKPPNINSKNSIWVAIKKGWTKLHFPSASRHFRFDNINPNEWSLVYCNKWSRIGTWTFAYFNFAGIFVCLYMLYQSTNNGRNFAVFKSDYEEENDDYQFLIGIASIIMLMTSLIISQAFYRFVIRGYYSPKRQQFILIKPNILTPWKVRKLVCAPGGAQVLPSGLSDLFGSVKIGNSKVILIESNFTLPAYYNVICGYAPVSSLTSINTRLFYG